MKTIIIQIGNSDDKRTQKQWHEFHQAVHGAVMLWSSAVHFAGTADGHAPWQNACWVVECAPGNAVDLKRDLAAIGREFELDSIAWTEGETAFI